MYFLTAFGDRPARQIGERLNMTSVSIKSWPSVIFSREQASSEGGALAWGSLRLGLILISVLILILFIDVHSLILPSRVWCRRFSSDFTEVF